MGIVAAIVIFIAVVCYAVFLVAGSVFSRNDDWHVRARDSEYQRTKKSGLI